MQRRRHFGVLSTKRDVNMTHFPSRLKDLCGREVKKMKSQRKWVTSRLAVRYRHNRAEAHKYL